MSWRHAGLVWLCAVLLLAVAVPMFWWTGREAGTDDAHGVLHASPGDITRVALERGGDAYLFERMDDGWVQVEPVHHRIDGHRIEDLLDRVSRLEIMRAITPDSADLENLAGLGFEPPRARLRLESDQDATALDLGRPGLAGRAWLRGGDGTLLVASRDVHDLVLDQHPTSWRDLHLFPETTIDVNRIERTVSGETMVLERAGRAWRVVEPLATRADAEMVMAHIGEIAGVRASNVLLDQPPDASAFGLDPPVARVVVSGPDGRTALRIGDRLGGTTQDRYAMVEGIDSVVQLPERDVMRLLGDPAALVARTGTGAVPMDVHGIRIRSGEDDLLLERRLDQWTAVSDTEVPVASGVVEHLLTLLSRTKAVEVTLLEQYPSELEVAVITLLDRAGGPIDSVRVLREPGGASVSGEIPGVGPGRWGLENGDRVVRILAPEHQVPVSPADFAVTP